MLCFKPKLNILKWLNAHEMKNSPAKTNLSNKVTNSNVFPICRVPSRSCSLSITLGYVALKHTKGWRRVGKFIFGFHEKRIVGGKNYVFASWRTKKGFHKFCKHSASAEDRMMSDVVIQSSAFLDYLNHECIKQNKEMEAQMWITHWTNRNILNASWSLIREMFGVSRSRFLVSPARARTGAGNEIRSVFNVKVVENWRKNYHRIAGLEQRIIHEGLIFSRRGAIKQ